MHQLSDNMFQTASFLPSAAFQTADHLKSGTKLKSQKQLFDNARRSISISKASVLCGAKALDIKRGRQTLTQGINFDQVSPF